MSSRKIDRQALDLRHQSLIECFNIQIMGKIQVDDMYIAFKAHRLKSVADYLRSQIVLQEGLHCLLCD